MDQAQKRLAVVWLALMALIFWFFMQLRTEKGLIRVFAVGTIAWLLILLTFATIDYATR